MKIKAIRTRVMNPPKDDLYGVIKESIKKISEKSILVVTSKVVAIHQERCVEIEKVSDKDKLIKQEAERYLPRSVVPGEHVLLTIKNNLIIPSAGIDESNAGGYYILWPRKVHEFTYELWEFVREQYGVKDMGIIVSDSHTIPMRWGVIGISLAHAGFCPLNDYRGQKDIFGRELLITLANVVDSISAAAVLEMGEGKEQTPLALVTDLPFVTFGDCPEGVPTVEVDPEIDLYSSLIKSVEWQKGGSG